MPTQLARLVSRRAQRAIYLLDGLRHAIEDLDRPEYLAVLDLVREDAAASREACQQVIRLHLRRREIGLLVDLRHLSRLGGAKGLRLGRRIARHIEA